MSVDKRTREHSWTSYYWSPTELLNAREDRVAADVPDLAELSSVRQRVLAAAEEEESASLLLDRTCTAYTTLTTRATPRKTVSRMYAGCTRTTERNSAKSSEKSPLRKRNVAPSSAKKLTSAQICSSTCTLPKPPLAGVIESAIETPRVGLATQVPARTCLEWCFGSRRTRALRQTLWTR
ncbi:hypothetical protein PybrP1_009140 [[Pythium] brassicae (nom. inval.)]|nr:hypothetical protein PybrP1_009140 [[Pythium] brassicae (nom. inval.)]